ncbi:hypothetical protein BX616_008048 [Lobosporangium transversale]|uniref:Uncharacterized protein n=1 Tax=Lobosporangium transversale TaxID=64571 RepID=A0A1Y2GIS0_9FUNG|nr:hypothetical protein BCR41DRAFT_397718 [Lobosporangium transversale]KAF9896148.1 hypothetical protein BX616_008048 [Lobosporangium transversale]ORZ12134.1 hypothetical protein BCR41DRAFT_397718 [Lobosporangium transversale]|eukprot:XP_021879999.1 hypothetical protein BCR41DRAFT_397718 [Lobosporangium transversale]
MSLWLSVSLTDLKRWLPQYTSSSKVERMGLLAAILPAPPSQDICVELDNQAIVIQYQQLVESRHHTLPSKRLRLLEQLGWLPHLGKSISALNLGPNTVRFQGQLADNAKDTAARCHHTKKLHGMLPTLNVIQARKPFFTQIEFAVSGRAATTKYNKGHKNTNLRWVNLDRDLHL